MLTFIYNYIKCYWMNVFEILSFFNIIVLIFTIQFLQKEEILNELYSTIQSAVRSM